MTKKKERNEESIIRTYYLVMISGGSSVVMSTQPKSCSHHLVVAFQRFPWRLHFTLLTHYCVKAKTRPERPTSYVSQGSDRSPRLLSFSRANEVISQEGSQVQGSEVWCYGGSRILSHQECMIICPMLALSYQVTCMDNWRTTKVGFVYIFTLFDVNNVPLLLVVLL